MRVIYDRETDTLSIILREGRVVESDEAGEGLILDYDKGGRLVSLEMLDASERIEHPQSVEFAFAGRTTAATAVRDRPAKRYGS